MASDCEFVELISAFNFPVWRIASWNAARCYICGDFYYLDHQEKKHLYTDALVIV